MSPFTEHLFAYRAVQKRKLILSLSITLMVMIVELIGGFLTNSIALISDAGHMFTHSFAIGISLIAILIARKPPCHHRTFGLYRAEILAAFINGLFLILVVGVILYEAVQRIIHPEEILALHMLLIALIGLVTNGASIFILHGSHKDDLNVRSVFYHMIADAASSVGIVIAAIVISYTGWNILDPLVSFGISGVIAYWAFGILKESARILLEMAPAGLNTDTISEDLKVSFPEIKELHSVHLWTITPDILVFSAHIEFKSSQETGLSSKILLSKINRHLFETYGIKESTLQTVTETEPQLCISD
ncbi:MAG: cation transporter [Gemmatimonadota bacterium]|nr:MAG: cation transporter [Gemmatimonadota bacterium]